MPPNVHAPLLAHLTDKCARKSPYTLNHFQAAVISPDCFYCQIAPAVWLPPVNPVVFPFPGDQPCGQSTFTTLLIRQLCVNPALRLRCPFTKWPVMERTTLTREIKQLFVVSRQKCSFCSGCWFINIIFKIVLGVRANEFYRLSISFICYSCSTIRKE